MEVSTQKTIVYEYPTLNTYIDIIEATIHNWDTCVSWAQPTWLGNVLFVLCILMIILYIFTVVMIIRMMKRRPEFRSPFYHCILILALGDVVTLIMGLKEGEIQACVISNSPSRSLAWEAIGAFCIENLITVNLAISIIRVNAVSVVTNQADEKVQSCLITFLTLYALIWPILIWILKHNGFIERITFPSPDTYLAEYLTPFKELHRPLQLFELTITFVFYLTSFAKLISIKKVQSAVAIKRKIRILLMAAFIFVSELFFLYSAYWIGFNYLDLGSAAFNANLNYIGKPVTSGITPIIYFIFSREIRQCCFGFLYKKKIMMIQQRGADLHVLEKC